ncbi:MAG: efflux transporter periplasmic adaptor subunit [Nitrospirae bacterium GWC2_56_14]|nr:MAG: efflux transporter periplasmic adaptor subunit [Nitrospirae bacterium GWC2_56_14]
MITKTDNKKDITEILGVDGSSGHTWRWTRRRTLMVVLGVIVAVIVSRLLAGNGAPVRYKTQDAKRGSLTVVVTATGTLQPTNTVSVGSEVSGIVKTVEVTYNSRVVAGQVLARMDTTKLEAQHTQARAALESARAKVLQTEATVVETKAKLAQYQKVRELSKNKVPSQSEMSSAEASYERAKADAAAAAAAVSEAQAAVQANETDLSKSVIRSPIKGVVLTRSIEPGQTVAASFQAPTLFTLAEDLAKMDLHVNVDEADIGKVREGQNANFSVSAYPNRTFRAQITQARYGSTTTSGVVTYETVLKVDNKDLALRPGMTATADITVQEIADALLVPNAALRFTPVVQETTATSGGSLVSKLLPRPPQPKQNNKGQDQDKKQQKVWILQDGKPTAIELTTGASNGILTEVVSGNIEPGVKLLVETENQGQ